MSASAIFINMLQTKQKFNKFKSKLKLKNNKHSAKLSTYPLKYSAHTRFYS